MGVLQTWSLAYWWVSNCFSHELSYVKDLHPTFLSLFSMSFVLPSTICLVSWIPRIPVLWTPDIPGIFSLLLFAAFLQGAFLCIYSYCNGLCRFFFPEGENLFPWLRLLHSWPVLPGPGVISEHTGPTSACTPWAGSTATGLTPRSTTGTAWRRPGGRSRSTWSWRRRRSFTNPGENIW